MTRWPTWKLTNPKLRILGATLHSLSLHTFCKGTYLSPEFVTNFMISWRKLESPKNGSSIEPHFFHIWLFRGSIIYFFCNNKSHLGKFGMLMKCVPITFNMKNEDCGYNNSSFPWASIRTWEGRCPHRKKLRWDFWVQFVLSAQEILGVCIYIYILSGHTISLHMTLLSVVACGIGMF